MRNQPFVLRYKNIVWYMSALILLALALAACQPAIASPELPATTPAPETTIVPTTAPTSAPTSASTVAPEITTSPMATTAPTATSVITSTAAIAPTGTDAVINVADHPELGQILVDGEGMALYMFTKDEPDKSNCAGQCLENWPPLLTQGNPVSGEGVDPSMIGTATLEDGSMIITYNHMPLYYWIRDKAPGDATGQGNNDVWYVVAPDGNPVGLSNANTNANENVSSSDDNGNTNSNANENSNDNSGDDGNGYGDY